MNRLPVLNPVMRHHEFAIVLAMLLSPDCPSVVVGYETCILQSVQRESGNGRCFNIEVSTPQLKRKTVFVRVEG